MRTGYVVFKNFMYMIFSNALSRVLSLLTVIYLANILGPQDFGRLNWAIVFVSYFAVIADFGSSITAAKDLSSDRNRISELIGKVIGFKFLFSILAFILCFASALLIRRSIDDILLMLFSGLTIFSSVTFFLSWVFQGLEEMKHFSYSLVMQSLFYVAAIFLFVDKNTPVYLLPIILFLSQSVAVICQFYRLKKMYPEINKLSLDFSSVGSSIAKNAHITWSHFISILGQNSPLFLIGLFCSPATAGFFAASQKISTLFWEIISNFSNVLFPALSRNFSKDPKKFNKMVNYALKLTFVLLTPLLVLIAVLSYSITQFVYGNAFIESYWTLKILIFLPLFMFLDSMASNILIISARQKHISFIKTLTTICAFVLSAIPARKAAINVVALTFILSFLVSAVWQYKKVSDLIKIEWKNCVFFPLLFSAFAAAAVFYIKALSLTLAFFMAIVGYMAMIHLYGVFNMEEKEYFKSSLKILRGKFINMEVQ